MNINKENVSNSIEIYYNIPGNAASRYVTAEFGDAFQTVEPPSGIVKVARY